MADYRELGYADDLTFNAQESSVPELSSLSGATDSGSSVAVNDNGVLGASQDDDSTNVAFNSVDTTQLHGEDLMEQLNMAQYAYIKGGVTTYRSGAGFFLGWYKPLSKFVFFVGDSSGDNMYYDGTNLTISGALNAGSINIPDANTTADSFHVDTVGNMWIGCTTTNFTSNHRNAKAYIENDGDAFFQNVEVNGTIRTVVFEKDVVSAVGGELIVANADKINTDMTALDSSAMVISGETTLALNSIVHIKDGIDEEYLRVTNVGSAPSYTVTRDLAGAYSSNANPAWKKGTAIVIEGLSDGAAAYSGGYLRLLGSGTNAPRYGVFKRTGLAYNAVTEYIGLGNLNGLIDYVADDYGIAIGSLTDGYLTFETTNGLRIVGAAQVNGSTLGFQDIYGDGSDGSVTISSNTSLTRDMFYNNLTIDSGFTLNPAGFRVHVKGTLTVNGTLGRTGSTGGAGGNGSTSTGGTAGAAAAALADGSIKGTSASSAGGAGGNGLSVNGSGSAGSNGSNAGDVAKSITAVTGKNGSAGGIGGKGYAAGSSNNGGAAGSGGTGGTVSGTVYNLPRTAMAAWLLQDFFPALDALKSSSPSAGGGGGGGGGWLRSGVATGTSGGGGGGGGGGGAGGIVAVYAKKIVVGASGAITATGGVGGAGGAGAAGVYSSGGNVGMGGGAGGGGGGGGCGGVLMLVYSSLTNAGTVAAAGGAGGALGAAGLGAGSDGRIAYGASYPGAVGIGEDGDVGVVGATGTAGLVVQLII